MNQTAIYNRKENRKKAVELRIATTYLPAFFKVTARCGCVFFSPSTKTLKALFPLRGSISVTSLSTLSILALFSSTSRASVTFTTEVNSGNRFFGSRSFLNSDQHWCKIFRCLSFIFFQILSENNMLYTSVNVSSFFFTLTIKFFNKFRWIFYRTLLKELRNDLCIMINGPFRLNVIKSYPKCLDVIPLSHGI